jgi:opacity protein-like surface antigen
MTPRYLLLTAAVLALPPLAASAQDGGFYLRAFGGASQLRDTDVTGAVTGPAQFGSGPVAGAAFGHDYAGSPFRSEIEFAYRSGEADPFGGGATVDFASTTLMLNGYYDFATTGRLTPYVGAGAGFVTEIDFDISGGAAPGEYSDRGGFAWQAMAGVSFALSDRLGLTTELRYFDAGRRTLSGAGSSVSADYSTLDVIAGVSLRF